MNDFYVYLYLREDNTPYYVGKGKGDRAFKNFRRTIKSPSDKSRIVFHTKNLTEEEAFELEKKLIAEYGRKDNGTGILRNLTDGGEGASGLIFSDERLAKQSAAIKEAMNRPEVKAKISDAMKVIMNKPEVKAKRSAAMKEVMSRPEVKAKISQNNGMKRPEVKAKISDAMKVIMNKPEVKDKYRMAIKEGLNRPEVKAKISAGLKEYYRKKREAEQASANTLTKFFSE